MALKYTSPPASNPNDSLPHSVQGYLDKAVTEGGRNRALFDAAAQMRDIGADQGSTVELLQSKALADGLPEREIITAIESAFRLPPREAPKGKNSSQNQGVSRAREYKLRPAVKPAPKKQLAGFAGAAPMAVPEPITENGFEQFLLAAFNEGDGVCISRGREQDNGDITPDVGVTLPREQWLKKIRARGGIEKVESTKMGLYVRVNPLTPLAKRNLNEDVTDFRHVLVEFDTDESGAVIPKEKQFGMMVSSFLPITAITDSGNKSLHAWVRVDAENADEYKERAEQIFALFPNVDEANKNPNRLSRAPDGFRTVNKTVVRQRLLKLALGAESFEEWEAQNAAKDQGESWGLMELMDYDVPNDPNKVIGDRWLCHGGSVVIVAPSGIGKSSLNMQFALGWSHDNPAMTFGIRPLHPLRQLILQAENDKGDVAEGLQGVAGAFNLDRKTLEDIDKRLFFRRITTLTGEDFLDAVTNLVNFYRPDVCWIDPLLNFIGDDASKQDVIAKFCVEGLNIISQRTGVIFALIHHTAKPKAAADRKGQTATDLAYAGFGSSGLTNWAREVVVLDRVLIENEEVPTFRMTCTKRRTRAGMMTLPDNGDEPRSTDHIYVRHAKGRIAWEQCSKPDDGDEGRAQGGSGRPFQTGNSANTRGRPSSITAEQKLLIADAVNANGGDPQIPNKTLDDLSRKIGKTTRTVRRYLCEVADKQKAARAELVKEGAIAE